MAEVTRTTAKTYFNTGDTPTEQQFANVMDSIPFPASDAVFSALSGNVWDGSYKALTLNSNTALTFSSSKRSGVLLVKQDATGSRTLSINGTAATINTAANSTTIITFLYNDVTSDYIFSVETGLVGVTGGLDTTAPTLVSAIISNGAASNIVLTYNEPLDAASIPATTDFDIHVNGATRNRDSVSISGNAITIHLTSPVAAGDTVVISYLAGGVNKIQDVAGNDASAFIDTPVTNNVAAGDTTAPTVVSKTTTSTTNIRIVFSEAVTASLAGWSFKQNGSALAASAISGSGTTWDFTVAAMAAGDTLLVSYNSTTGATVDSASNELASFTDSAVTNSLVGPDADVEAWATASGITDTTYKGHINTFVTALKTAGIFSTHFDFIHILCGGDATKSQFNLINPANTDAAYRLTFNNGGTFAATGVTGNGTNQTISSHFIPGLAAKLSQNDAHIAVYHRTSAGANNPVWGINQTGSQMYLFPKEAAGAGSFKFINKSNQSFTPANAKGFWLVRRNTTNVQLYKDGVNVTDNLDNAAGDVFSSTYDLVFNGWNNNGTPAIPHAGEISIISAGKYLNDTQKAAYESAVAQLVTNLGL